MARMKTWWRTLFTDHPGLAEHLLDAYTGGGRPKVWCDGCLQVAEASHRCADGAPFSSIWDDAVACQELKAQGRGWVPYRNTTCLYHLSDCPVQSEQTRKKAREQLKIINTRRRASYRAARPTTRNQVTTSDVSQASGPAAMNEQTTRSVHDLANELTSCVPDTPTLHIPPHPPSAPPTIVSTSSAIHATAYQLGVSVPYPNDELASAARDLHLALLPAATSCTQILYDDFHASFGCFSASPTAGPLSSSVEEVPQERAHDSRRSSNLYADPDHPWHGATASGKDMWGEGLRCAFPRPSTDPNASLSSGSDTFDVPGNGFPGSVPTVVSANLPPSAVYGVEPSWNGLPAYPSLCVPAHYDTSSPPYHPS